MTRPLLILAALAALPGTAPAAPCLGGQSGGYACDAIGFLGQLPLGDIGSQPGRANDIWGFRDYNTEREYALLGLDNGLAIVDVTDPAAPVSVATVAGQVTTWRDVKVLQYHDPAAGRFRAYAYLVADGASDGLVVVDLSGLPGGIATVGRRTDESRAHNVYIANVDPGTNLPLDGFQPVLYTSGSDLSGGVARAYSLAVPGEPGFIAAMPAGGDSHDLASVVVADARAGQCPNAAGACVLLADANEDTLQLWDATDPSDPRLLSATTYAGLGYVHSATFTEDGRYLVVQDELDEIIFEHRTRQRVFDLANLAQPVLAATWTGPAPATDHNGFVRGNRLYLSNYNRGLTVIDLSDLLAPVTAGFLDTRPETDAVGFDGAWGVYPWLPSGVIAVSDVQRGLFLLVDEGLSAPADVLSPRPVSGGEEGGTVNVPVTRSGSQGAVAVSWTLATGSAGPDDFTLASGRISWADGEAGARSVGVELTADGEAEDVERLFLRLHSPEGGAVLGPPATATVFIADAGAPTTLGFAATELEVAEDGRRVVLILRRAGGVSGTAGVRYRVAGGTATAGEDYGPVADGLLEWPDGDATARSLVVSVLRDGEDEPDETLELELYDPRGGSLDPAANIARVRIVDVPNRAPRANAGADLFVQEGARVTLNGGLSSDPDGDAVTYSWVQVQGPEVALDSPADARPAFTAPAVATSTVLAFELTVTDPFGAAATDTVGVTVQDSVPPPVGGGGGGGGGGAASWLLLLLCAARACGRARSIPAA